MKYLDAAFPFLIGILAFIILTCGILLINESSAGPVFNYDQAVAVCDSIHDRGLLEGTYLDCIIEARWTEAR